MNFLLEFIKNADIAKLLLHNISNHKHFYSHFKNYFNFKKETHINKEIVYNFIENKRILIISPFANLMKNQIISGNVAKIYSNMKSVNYVYAYENPYTFFNNGPHNNIFDTVSYLVTDINNKIPNNYDSVLISCGAYSLILANEFYKLGKNVCTVGGSLQVIFGILNERHKRSLQKKKIEIEKKEYWITEIPNEYKPNGYKKIEGGCYW